MKSADDPMELEVERVIRVTDKALLCEIDGVDYWIPKSQIVDGGTVNAASEEGAAGDVLVTAWWAKERGLE